MMETKDIATITVSLLALVVSVTTAYRTFFAKFNGRVWFSNRIVLTHIDRVLSLGFACFFENSGAKPGILDDLRAKVEQKDSGTITYFYPILMRSDYSIFKSYSESDWYPFSMVSLPPSFRAEKYLLLKPLNDQFTAVKGDMNITLELRWHGDGDWIIINPTLSFNLVDEIVEKWRNPESPAYQIISNDVVQDRRH